MRFKRLIKFFLLFVLLLCVLLGVAAYYFLNTESGLKQAIALANRYSGYQISAEEISGKLWQKTELNGVKISGNGLEMSSGSVVLAWQPKQLWDYRVVINAVTLTDTVISVANTETNKQSTATDFELADIALPVAIDIEDIKVVNLTVNNPVTKQPVFVVDSFQLGIDYIQQRGEIHTLRFLGQGIDLNMQGHILTKGDYPLSLQNTTQYTSTAYGNQIVKATINGALKQRLTLDIQGEGLSDFSLQGNIDSLLDNPRFQADFSLKQFAAKQLNLPDTAANATLSVRGDYQTNTAVLNVTADGDMTYSSPQTDKVQVAFAAKLDEKQLNISDLTVDLLTAKQQLRGKGAYGLADESLHLTLNSEALSWPQSDNNPPVSAKDLQATISGKLSDYQIAATTTLQTTAAGDIPLQLAANGQQEALEPLQLTAWVNEQPLDISGKLAWQPSLDYQLNMAAKDITPFKDFPGLKDFLVTVSGDEKRYQAKGGGHVFSSVIAPTDMTLVVYGTPQQLQQADLQFKTLGGEVTAQAKGDLVPLQLAANLSVDNIQPQTFYRGVDAKVDAQITAQLTEKDGNLLASSTIKQLSGRLQKQPLSGSGKVIYDQAQQVLSVQTLDVNLAGNRLQADGQLSTAPTQGHSQLAANLDANYLSRLLPQLSGRLSGKILAKGTLSKPELAANLQGSQLKYQQNQLAKLAANIQVSLAEDKVNIVADTQGVRLGENAIDAAKLGVQGKLSSHTLTLNVRSPKSSALPTVALAGKGGLNTDSLVWTGKLNQLNLNSNTVGQWRLPTAGELVLSADKVVVKKLCLQQQKASLCADGQLRQQNGQFTVQLKQLPTQRFAALMPKAVNVDTVLQGDAVIDFVNGEPTVKGNITAKGGNLKLATGSGALLSEIQQFETDLAVKNQRAEAIVKTQLSKLGTIQLAAAVPNISQPNMRANIKLDSNDLRFLEELVPQLSDVKGRLNGDMTVSGNPSQQLKVAGKVTLQKTQFNVPQFGTEIRDLTLDIFAKNGNTLGFRGGANAGKGKFTIDGRLNPTSQKGQINLKGSDFQVANAKKLQVAISPDLQIVFSDNIKIRGDIFVPKALIVPESSGSKITASDDVVLPKSKTQKTAANSPIDAEVNIKLGDDVRVASADIETRLSGGLKIAAKPRKPITASGNISVQTGELRVYGQLLNIERGRIIFNGPVSNPSLDIRTTREVDDVTVGATLLGTVQHPEVSLFSSPGMSDSSILSYLLFGRPPDSQSFSSTALLQTGGLVGANTLARGIRSSVGLDVLNFTLTGMEAGKNLSKKLYVGMKSDFFTAVNEFLLKYKINSSLHVEGAFSGEAASVDLIKVLETD